MDSSRKSRQSRSRSTTPGTEEEYRTTRSGRKTPTGVTNKNQAQIILEPIIIEENEDRFSSPPAFRTRSSRKETSDYSSENSPDRVSSLTKEQLQNIKNYTFEEHIYTTRTEKSDVIQSTQDFSHNRRRSQASPSQSDSSFKSSFAELTLADVSKIKDVDDSDEYLPYKLYKYAGEYWNKYPKTDYAYSPYSKDYVELAPGQPAMPNMSRRSLQNYRLYGSTVDADEVEYISNSSMSADSLLKKSWNSYEGFQNRYNNQENERARYNGGGTYNKYPVQDYENENYWFTRLFIYIWTKIVTTVTTITTTTTNTNGNDPVPFYYGNRAEESRKGVLSKAAGMLFAPFFYMTSIVSKFASSETITTTSEAGVKVAKSRKFWLFLLPLLFLLAWSRLGYDAPGLQILKVENLHRHVVEVLGIQTDRPVGNSLKKSDVVSWINDELETKLSRLKAELVADMKTSEQNQKEAMSKLAESLKLELHAWHQEISEDIHHQISINTKETKEVNIIHKYDEDRVKKIIAEILAIYDADKTGRVDYAMESAGGQVISIRCTESYQPRTAQFSVLGIPLWWPSITPRVAITPGAVPGDCWAFQGFPGYLVIRLFSVVNVTGFTLEHMPKTLAPEGKIESAPKNFSVWGLLSENDVKPHKFGEYMYDENSSAIQYFPVKIASIVEISTTTKYPVAYDIIELRIGTNYGNPSYTCLYRFRVHGEKVNEYVPTTTGNTEALENR